MIYISGAMTGIKDLNYPEFNRVAKLMRDAGIEVFNPTEVKFDKTGLTDEEVYEKYMEIDLRAIERSQAILMLKGWQHSKGAVRELARARERGLLVLYQRSESEMIWLGYALGENWNE